MSTETNPETESSPRQNFGLFEVLGYFFRKPDPSRPKNFNIRAMHTINKISMLMFLVGLVYFIFKMVMR